MQDNQSASCKQGCHKRVLLAPKRALHVSSCAAPETKDWRALRCVFSLARQGNSSSAWEPELPMTSGCPVSVVPAAG